MKIFPTRPGVQSCLNTNRVDHNKGYGCRQVTDNSLAETLADTRAKSRSMIAKVRNKQAEANPLADGWEEETPQLNQYYSRIKEDAAEDED